MVDYLKVQLSAKVPEFTMVGLYWSVDREPLMRQGRTPKLLMRWVSWELDIAL